MERAQSRDGTQIAFDRQGKGPPLILIDGALCYRASGPMRPLAELLKQQFTVFTYDRRGRGDSGDGGSYSVEREVEDLNALIKVAGGSAFVYGISSGAALALEAAHRGLAIEKLALYEAPFIVDDSRAPLPTDYIRRLKDFIASDRRGDAVKLFMGVVGIPAIFVGLMRFMPAWARLKAVAHTLIYDGLIVEEYQRGRPLPPRRWAGVTSPTLVVTGGKSPAWMKTAMRALVGVVPGAKGYTLEGQTHMVKATALAPVLVEFFTNSGSRHAEAVV